MFNDFNLSFFIVLIGGLYANSLAINSSWLYLVLSNSYSSTYSQSIPFNTQLA